MTITARNQVYIQSAVEGNEEYANQGVSIPEWVFQSFIGLPLNNDGTLPTQAFITERIQTGIPSAYTGPVFMDVETPAPWAFGGGMQSTLDNLARHVTLLNWCKAARPNAKFTYYNKMQGSHTSFPDCIPLSGKQAISDAGKPLYDLCGVHNPYVPNITENINHWYDGMCGKIAEFKRVSPGIPIIPHISIRYHPVAPLPLRNQRVPLEYFRAQLNFLRDHLDVAGLSIWTGAPHTLNVENVWWKALIAFLPTLQVAPSTCEQQLVIANNLITSLTAERDALLNTVQSIRNLVCALA